MSRFIVDGTKQAGDALASLAIDGVGTVSDAGKMHWPLTLGVYLLRRLEE